MDIRDSATEERDAQERTLVSAMLEREVGPRVTEAAVKVMTSRQTLPTLKNSYGFGLTVTDTGFGHGNPEILCHGRQDEHVSTPEGDPLRLADQQARKSRSFR